jgi:hypothetical protein
VARPEVVRVANALRTSQRREITRTARAPVEGVVLALDPLTVDLQHADVVLGPADLSFGRQLRRHLEDEPLTVGDTLALVEVSLGDYTAIDVMADD